MPYRKGQAVKINVVDKNTLGVKSLVIKRADTDVQEFKRPGKAVIERSLSTCGDYTAHCVMRDGSLSQACEFSVCDLDFSIPAAKVSKREPWKIPSRAENMTIIVPVFVALQVYNDEHNVFVSEQDRRNERL